MRYGGVLEYDGGTISDNYTSYADASSIATWARTGVSYCLLTDLMKGDANSKFNPAAHVTRAEFAQILLNLDNKIYAIWSRLTD
uniref:CAZy families GH66 protein n=1 Tax=uncultured Paenibacillus sp. TaxID=227322 RepID=A0A060CAU6_9BACL|nr:CAZy families GH66 protein [uncultured Paenibacillus sp.]